MTDFNTSTMPALQELRASLDERLDALEIALADPKQHSSLERLILELARVATEEADASARTAVGAIRTEGLSALEAERRTAALLRQELEEARSAQDAEREASHAVRRQLDEAEQQLTAVRQRLTDAQEQLASTAGAAEQAQVERSALRRELENALSAVKAERNAAAAAQQELASLKQTREQEQAERATFKRELQNALGMVKTERARVSSLEEALAETRSQLEAARTDADARVTNLSGSQAGLEQDLQEARQALQNLEARADAAEARAQEWQQRAEEAETHAADARARAEHDQAHAAEAILELDSLKEELESSSRPSHHGPETASKYEELLHSSEHRIRSLELALRDAETRAESAECELALQRRGAAAWPDGDPKPAGAELIGTPSFPGPVRGAKRVAMSAELIIEVDGARARLIDVSTTGAQILASASMKPNRLVRLAVPHADRTIVCKGKIMWARLEPKGSEIWYRAGLTFTTVDESDLDGFIKSHQPAR
jgi:chromosome segregation ATPase